MISSTMSSSLSIKSSITQPLRLFSTSSRVTAGRRLPPYPLTQQDATARRRADAERGKREEDALESFALDDVPTTIYMRLEKIKEVYELHEKVEIHRQLLQEQRRPFQPPTAPIRITSTVDLTFPDVPIANKRVLLAPVAALPLSSPDAIHRFKLLAGPRWSPGRPGEKEMEYEGNKGYNAGDEKLGREGWIKISEATYPSARMNRKSASDILDRLIATANDEKSQLATDIPIDMRHLLARQRRRNIHGVRGTVARVEAQNSRPHTVGHVKGFPVEWLSPEARDKVRGLAKSTTT
ncbi:mitochondrial ribosomal subunit protein-domain-containing protein [Naematelia encephala]|uniref:Mitochondrial ribosomal subunit protein-domain-containing protein n=1 Tax=Naematelia encephala TaxID=71784 RepID=A0A1Y2B9A6_9TREE|nr:mitochondrial ribosomal subunit protein-domain-containing protein [Naematelia encephala]